MGSKIKDRICRRWEFDSIVVLVFLTVILSIFRKRICKYLIGRLFITWKVRENMVSDIF